MSVHVQWLQASAASESAESLHVPEMGVPVLSPVIGLWVGVFVTDCVGLGVGLVVALGPHQVGFGPEGPDTGGPIVFVVKSKHDMNVSGGWLQTPRFFACVHLLVLLYSSPSNVSVFRPTLFASTQELAVFQRSRPTPKPLEQDRLTGTLYLAVMTAPSNSPSPHAKIFGLLGMKF
jgi:hypothetical protein